MKHRITNNEHKKKRGLSRNGLAAPQENIMLNSQDKSILKREKKQILGFLAAIRTEANEIEKKLASMIVTIGAARASQLGISMIISELEEKLEKK